jgi:putative DNA primase/helicase
MKTVRNVKPKESAMDPHKLGRNYIKRHGTDITGRTTLRFYRNEWWRYEDGRYGVVSNTELMAHLGRAIKEEVDSVPLVNQHGVAYGVTKSLVGNVASAITGTLLVPEGREMPLWLGEGDVGSLLAFKNGLVDVNDALNGIATLKPLTPEWFSSVRFPYGFDAAATAPRWERFLHQVLEGDGERIALLQEFFGYLLTPDTSFHKFMVLEGDGANGKSVVLEILGEMLGPENISHVPLGMFGDRFQLTPTLNRLANIAPEADDTEKPNIGTLKQFTAGDRMYFDRKGIPGIEAKPTARLIIATNNRPAFADLSSALWRRLLLIPFQVSIPESQQDRELARKLRQELPGILNWALEGLKRLRVQGQFTEPAVSVAALAEYRAESNPTGLFLEDFCEAEKGQSVLASDLYAAYQQFCKARGYAALNDKRFGKELKKRFPNMERRRPTVNGFRHWVYDGIRLTYPTGAYMFDPQAELQTAA